MGKRQVRKLHEHTQARRDQRPPLPELGRPATTSGGIPGVDLQPNPSAFRARVSVSAAVRALANSGSQMVARGIEFFQALGNLFRCWITLSTCEDAGGLLAASSE